MSALNGYWSSKLGATGIHAFTLVQSRTLPIVPGVPPGNTLLSIYTTQDVYLRQGGADVVVTTSDFILRAGSPWPLLVENILDNYLAVLGVTESGDLRVTNTTDLVIIPFGEPPL